jgi:hypothetical protein
MQEELRKDLQNEVVKEVNYKDFGLKTLSKEEKAEKEKMVREALERGDAPVDMVNGELKMQFTDAVNIPGIQGKLYPCAVIGVG